MTKVLCILDGFGIANRSQNNIPSVANMPHFRSLLKNYWWTTLNADGVDVGQETGLVGNSEVGHMNIGGLRLVPQLSYQITKSASVKYDLNKQVYPDQLFDPKILLTRKFSQKNSKNIHLIGLFSTGTIHSDLRHWAGAIESAGNCGAEKIILHIVSDGRDSDRQSLVQTWEYFITEFNDKLKPFENKIFLGSLGGRFYSMDRDNNWDRVMLGLTYLLDNKNIDGDTDTIFNTKFNLDSQDIRNTFSQELDETMNKNLDISYPENYEELNQFSRIKQDLEFYTNKFYKQNIFDETLLPISFVDTLIKYNDTVWLLNYRTDRMKQFCQMLCDINQEFDLKLDILGMNDYCIGEEIYLDSELKISRQKAESGYHPIFKNDPVKKPLSEKVSQSGATQLHIAETEKYNHVTYFFNGGQNKKWEGEDWFLIDSNKVTSHAQMPAMKAVEITDYILENGLGKYDYIIVNYANPDMLGHTGDIVASIESMEVLDTQLGRLVAAIKAGGHKMIITADHGNVELVGEYVSNDKPMVDTEHNPNPVPMIIIDEQFNPLELAHKISSLVERHKLPADIGLVNTILTTQKNQIDITNPESWLNSTNIPEPKLALWYAGLIIFSM